jgi:hypothetical protein
MFRRQGSKKEKNAPDGTSVETLVNVVVVVAVRVGLVAVTTSGCQSIYRYA